MNTVRLSAEESALLAGASGPAARLAMKIVVRMGEILGARTLVEITSSHIDGCLYHGDGGVEFAERLVELGGDRFTRHRDLPGFPSPDYCPNGIGSGI